MNWKLLVRWRWIFNPAAERRLLNLVQMTGLTSTQQRDLDNMALDEDPRLKDYLEMYAAMGHTFIYETENT
jgi:hypothetical protein